MSHTIELKKVSKYYASEDSVSMGFSRVDLNLDIGEFVAITGESGSGKSTLLNVISGLDTYEEGEMFVCGEDTTAYNTEDYEAYRKTYIGNIFQDFNLINSYTVYQNVELVMLLSGKKKSECRERVLELIDLVGLSEYCNTKASKLSGGQKQRVAIARALAKDAPIIVADEPTGNLDSESAANVMETLARVAKDRLVVIVTHNYEQAEPYVTRKITMHDGKIIEDLKISPPLISPDNDGEDAKFKMPEQGRMRKSSELLLGVRNTFNLPSKFILLFIVYFFVSTAVLGQYAATRNSMHEADLLGSNPVFLNTSGNRLIIKKADESSFTDKDFSAIRKVPNIREVVKNDLAVDNVLSFRLGDSYVEGPVMPVSKIRAKDIAYGHLPRDEYEIVIGMDSASEALLSMGDDINKYIDKPVTLKDVNQTQTYKLAKEVKVAGIIVEDSTEEDSDSAFYGYSTIYASDEVSRDLLMVMMASVSEIDLNFAETTVVTEYEDAVIPSPNIPDGKVYLFEDQIYFYKNDEAVGKDFGLKVKNRFFESEGKYKVDKIITADNCEKLVGISKEQYDSYYNCVFISENDFRKLFDKGYYQISAFMKNELKSDKTQQALRDMGYTSLAIKDSLTDEAGDFGNTVDLVTYARLAAEFLVLLLIAYAVIRLIMKSRNSYYSTLRILGATKGNTDAILRVELVFMMLIAYGVDIALVVMIKKGVLQKLIGSQLPKLSKLLFYLTPLNCSILGAVLLLMSLLIANRYSRHIFTKSAMKAFREEVQR